MFTVQLTTFGWWANKRQILRNCQLRVRMMWSVLCQNSRWSSSSSECRPQTHTQDTHTHILIGTKSKLDSEIKYTTHNPGNTRLTPQPHHTFDTTHKSHTIHSYTVCSLCLTCLLYINQLILMCVCLCVVLLSAQNEKTPLAGSSSSSFWFICWTCRTEKLIHGGAVDQVSRSVGLSVSLLWWCDESAASVGRRRHRQQQQNTRHAKAPSHSPLGNHDDNDHNDDNDLRRCLSTNKDQAEQTILNTARWYNMYIYKTSFIPKKYIFLIRHTRWEW